jgi:hypothetical protein
LGASAAGKERRKTRREHRGQGRLAAFDEALDGEALEVGVDPHRHHHHLPPDARARVEP